MTAPMVSGGWRVVPGFAVVSDSDRSPHFYAVYEGEAFGHPERGIVAVLARGHASAPGDENGASDAAQLAVHGFVEGYFGARRTFGAKRAAELALTSMNSWLHRHVGSGSSKRLAPVSLTALLFQGASVGVVQIGAGRAFRCRRHEIVPLTGAHVRIGAEGRAEPVRAIGLDREVSVDYDELEAEPGDRFLLASGLDEGVGTVEAAFRLELPAGEPGCAVLLEVLAAPAPDEAARQSELAGLKLRNPPREGDVCCLTGLLLF